MMNPDTIQAIVAGVATPSAVAFLFFALLGGGVLAAIVAGAILGASG